MLEPGVGVLEHLLVGIHVAIHDGRIIRLHQASDAPPEIEGCDDHSEAQNSERDHGHVEQGGVTVGVFCGVHYGTIHYNSSRWQYHAIFIYIGSDDEGDDDVSEYTVVERGRRIRCRFISSIRLVNSLVKVVVVDDMVG